MLSSEEKLRRFSESVYQDAQKQSNALIKEAEKKASAETDAFETECLETEYKTIKKQMAQILKTANEKVSKAEIDAKKTLLLKREEIIKEVFTGVRDKIAAYKQTDDYKKYLLDEAEKASKLDKGNGVTVYLSKSDARFAAAIEETCGVKTAVSDTDDLIGGICVLVNNTNKVIDMSFAMRLSEAREEFLKSSGLTL